VFGGKPIRARGRLHFEEVDFDEGFCVLRQELSLDPVDTKDMLRQVFTKMDLDDSGMEEALRTAVFEINDSNTFEYYFDPGVPHKIETIRESIIDINKEKGKRIDKTLIELIYNQ